MMEVYWFGLGAILGSAANALIDRLPKNVAWTKGRSRCDKCKHELGARDLIPIISFAMLKGRCRYCKSPIPYRNLVVEIFLGLGFVGIWSYLSLPLVQTIVVAGILWVSTIIAVMDWETKLVSEAMIALWILLVVTAIVMGGVGRADWTSLGVGVLVGLGAIGGMWAVSRGRAMGFGDVEIAGVMGLWLGWPNIMVAIWAAFVSGACVGCGMLLWGKSKMKSEIAFGPFLVVGTWVAYLWGDKIISWFFP